MARNTTAIVALALGVCAGEAAAQQEFGIMDNSFLVEEAFNQERGIFQNIANYRWQRGEWLGSFTQEWPFPNMTHQLSFTIPFGRVAQRAAIGDVLVNYRLQVWRESDRRPAFAPRISVILPSAPDTSELGNGVVGWQFNAPFSKRHGDWYFHWNGGLTLSPGDTDTFDVGADALVSPFVAASAIWQSTATLNLLVEVVGESHASPSPTGAAERTTQLTVSPGFRYAWNVSDEKQVVIGMAAPVVRSEARTVGGVFAYFSYELPFK
jgi:hypothetical protein